MALKSSGNTMNVYRRQYYCLSSLIIHVINLSIKEISIMEIRNVKSASAVLLFLAGTAAVIFASLYGLFQSMRLAGAL
jgi:hypothetical protein